LGNAEESFGEDVPLREEDRRIMERRGMENRCG
jgi:hypothetical protein